LDKQVNLAVIPPLCRVVSADSFKHKKTPSELTLGDGLETAISNTNKHNKPVNKSN
tara:strand:+ start:238 stop:405 length:168 start_codon:yes stop_codon:yes gene_type:complete